MNADAFRSFYEYHFEQNRSLWYNHIMRLTDDQFTQPVAYSVGSVRNHIVHLIRVDDAWFRDVRCLPLPEVDPLERVNDRAAIRAHWDAVEDDIRAYLAGLTDEMLFQKPIAEGEDKDLILWQILLHVGNHGTDHRAQLLRLLHDLGQETPPQDFILYAYDHNEQVRS